MKTKILFSLLILIISISSCSNDDGDTALTPEQQLPPITTTGANTFGCLIDGVLFKPRSGSLPFDYAVTYSVAPDDISWNEIDIKDYKSEHTASLLLHIQNLKIIGAANYTINLSNGMNSIDGLNHNYLHCRVWRNSTQSYQYYRSFNNSGSITISRYDLPNRIVSGIFNCKVVNSTNHYDTIKITNGRFDFKWSTVSTKVWP